MVGIPDGVVVVTCAVEPDGVVEFDPSVVPFSVLSVAPDTVLPDSVLPDSVVDDSVVDDPDSVVGVAVLAAPGTIGIIGEPGIIPGCDGYELP